MKLITLASILFLQIFVGASVHAETSCQAYCAEIDRSFSKDEGDMFSSEWVEYSELGTEMANFTATSWAQLRAQCRNADLIAAFQRGSFQQSRSGSRFVADGGGRYLRNPEFATPENSCFEKLSSSRSSAVPSSSRLPSPSQNYGSAEPGFN